MRNSSERRQPDNENRLSARPRSVGPAAFLVWLLQPLLLLPLMAQDPPRKKPVLIRADQTTEAETEAEAITPSPVEAARHQKVGDFYYKRKNYKAAAERYRDAVLYDPKSAGRVLKFVQALEKLKLFGEAAQAFLDFLERNPNSPWEEDFRDRAKKLQEKEAAKSG